MTFADELRNNGINAMENRDLDAEVYYWCGRLTGAVKTVCRQAALEGRRRIFGYVHLDWREGHDETKFVRSLPLVKNLGTKSPDLSDKDASEKDIYSFSAGYGKFETRLYEGYIIPGDIRMIQKIEDGMREELQKLGFSDFRVQKVKLMDVYVIHYRRQSLLSGDRTERITTRTAPDPVYTLHFSISW